MYAYSKLSFESLEQRVLMAGDLPSLAIVDDAVVLPGDSSDLVTLSAHWTQRIAEYNNEVVFIDLDNVHGAVNGVLPTDADYAFTALGGSDSEVIFTSGQGLGDTASFTRPGGTAFASAIIQNASLQSWLSNNPSNLLAAGPAFFSFENANPDSFDHLQVTELADGRIEFAWEDLSFGGDQNFNDVIFTLEVVSVEHAPEQEERFTLEDSSPGVTIDEQSGIINWDELGPGTHQLTVTVNDSHPAKEEPPKTGEIPGDTDATQIFIEDFETGKIADFWAECSFCGSHTAVADDGTGNQVFETKYSHDEQAAQLSVYPLDDVESVFVSFNQKLPTGLPERALKSARVFQADGNKEGTLSLQLWPLEGTDKLVTEQQAKNGGGNYTPFDAGVDEWVRLSFLMKQNYPGQENGVLQVWRNNELVLDRSDVHFRNDFSLPDGVWVGGNYSGNGQDPVPFSRLIDDILIVTNPAEDFDHLTAIDAAFSSLGL